jgi:hypothetical protein
MSYQYKKNYYPTFILEDFLENPDDVIEYFIAENIKPVLFTQYNRNKKIEQLGL